MGEEDYDARRDFWEDVEDQGKSNNKAQGNRRSRTVYNEAKQEYERQFFDEFDDFFNFSG